MQPRVGHLVEPATELHVEVVEIAKGACEEDVLPYVAEWSLDPYPSSWACRDGRREVGSRSGGRGRQDCDYTRRRPSGSSPTTAVFMRSVQDLPRNAAEIGEGGHVASQHRAEVLMDYEAVPHQPRVAQHEREQPHDAFGAWLVGELDLEAGQIHLGLQAGRRFEAHLDRQGNGRPDGGDGALDRRVGAPEAALLAVPPQADGGQSGVGRDALAQEGQESVAGPRPCGPRLVDGRFQPAGDVFANRLAVHPELAGDGRDRQTLSVQVEDHHEFLEIDHRAAPSG